MLNSQFTATGNGADTTEDDLMSYTVPANVLGQMLKHPLTDIGLAKFMDDWKKVPK